MRELAEARRPLVIGIGGGGDVVGALAAAETWRLFHGADPIVGGVAWERRPIDPVPGPRRADEIEGAHEIAPSVLAATDVTKVKGRDVWFAESRLAGLLGVRTVLVDVWPGPTRIAAGLAAAAETMGSDLIVFLDVGGDALAHGDERGLASPLCDAVMLAAASHLKEAGVPVLGGVFGIGCDGELDPSEVLERLAEIGHAGGLRGATGITPEVAELMQRAIDVVPTEASAMALKCFQGAIGETQIRSGRRTVQLSPLGALTYWFDIDRALASAARLALLVRDAHSLEEANDALHSIGVRSELDYERKAAETA